MSTEVVMSFTSLPIILRLWNLFEFVKLLLFRYVLLLKPISAKDITHDEPDNCEDESSGSKDQFETPPATPSEHEKFVTPLSTEPPVSIVKKADEIAAAAIEPTPAPVAVPVPEPTPVIVEPEVELEEGEIVEETPAVTRPYRYTRDELILHREAQDKKPDLPNLECIMDTPQLKDNHQKQVNRSQNSFIPSWDQQGGRSKSRGADRGNRNNNDKQQSMSNKPRVIEHVMAPKVTRTKSTNAWLSKTEAGTKGKPPAETRDAQIFFMKGQVIAILNKITPQNFKDLSVKIIGLGFDDLEKLEIAVEIVFDKAVLEPAFSQTYANLCKVMSSIQFPDDPNPKVSPFRKTLLNRCQKEFLKEKSGELEISEKIAALPATLTEMERKREIEEFQYLRTKLKKKMLGNINFIGELYNLSMISAKIIMVSCIQYLLSKSGDEESIECLSKLFGTVGQKLELECSKVTTQSDMFEKNFVMFKQVAADRHGFPARIRFMVQDIVDLRENKWVPRREEAKPQKIDDIHREHAKQEQEKKMEAAMVQQSRKGKRNDSRDDRPRGSRDSRDQKKDEWNTTPQQRKIATNIDISKLQQGSQSKVDVSSLQLGPGGGRSIWGRGSGTGSGANSPLSGSKEDLSTTNRFDMMKNERKTVLCQGKTTSAPAPRGKVASEREAALANVMNIGKRRTPSPSPVRTPVTKSDTLTDEMIKTKTKSILTEYYSEEDLEEAVACVREELMLVKKHHVFVEAAIMLTLEQKLANNTKLGDLFSVLFTEDLMNADAFLQGCQAPFEIAEEVSIDVPGIYVNFGKLIGKCVAKNHVTLALVKSALVPLQASKMVGVVMCEILKDALLYMDQMQLQKKWAKERMSWQGLDDDHESLIEKYSLEFLSTSQEMPSEAPTTPDVFHQDMFGKMLGDKASNDQLFAYIEKQIPAKERTKPAFISSLTTAVCKACLQVDIDIKDKVTLSDESMKEYSPILIKYLQSGKENLEVEMEALNAVQLLVNDLQHPRDLAYFIFCAFDDADIVTTEGFKHWHTASKEQQGRGVIHQALKGFFNDLTQSDGDSDTNAPN